jgi:hypothetical protein
LAAGKKRGFCPRGNFERRSKLLSSARAAWAEKRGFCSLLIGGARDLGAALVNFLMRSLAVRYSD